jgi:addiction module HigA family antidote
MPAAAGDGRGASPGQVLRDEFLEPRGLTEPELARRMGVEPGRVQALVQGTHGVTPGLALRLARSLDTTPDFWMELQAAWEGGQD